MQEPKDFATVKGYSAYEAPEVGGHTMVIKEVKETTNKNGGDMIVVYFDFDSQDNQPDYFANDFKNNPKPKEEKKWSYFGTKWINCQYNGDTTRDFKSFCDCVLESNSGMKLQWGEKFAAQFKGKKIGGVFGLCENEYNGEIRTRSELRWFCPYDKAKDVKVPELKKLKDNGDSSSSGATDFSDFMAIPEGMEEELPFA